MSDADVTSTSLEPVVKTKTEALDDLFKSVNRSDAPGLVVAVAQRGKTVYRRGFGLASVELGVANTPRTRMRIGSTSKHFTSLAALLLAEEGKLDIDAGVGTYLPELSVLKPEPTLRQFMNHSSGYRCYLDIGFIADGNVIRPKGSALSAQVRQRGINFPPGERMIYCNGGYHLVSLIIEKVSGVTFETFLRERIFEPMGMADTASVPSDFEINEGMAVLHIPLPGGLYRRGIFPSHEVRGEGAIISTVDDMLRWIVNIRGPHKVGSDASWAQILAGTRLNNGTVNPYGLGMMRHPYRGTEVWHHAGGVIGGSCQMLTVPSHELDIIIMTNGGAINPTEAANKIIDIMVDEGDLQASRDLPNSDRFKPMVGTKYHASTLGSLIGFSEKEGKLTINFYNSQGLPLHEAEGVMQLDFEDAALGPLVVKTADLATEGEPPIKLVVSEGGNADTFDLLPATEQSATGAGAAMVGHYRADDLNADATIDVDGDTLRLRVFGAFGTNSMLLESFSRDVFGWKAEDALLPLTGSLSVQRSEGRIAGFALNTPRSRHIQFNRISH